MARRVHVPVPVQAARPPPVAWLGQKMARDFLSSAALIAMVLAVPVPRSSTTSRKSTISRARRSTCTCRCPGPPWSITRGARKEGSRNLDPGPCIAELPEHQPVQVMVNKDVPYPVRQPPQAHGRSCLSPCRSVSRAAVLPGRSSP